MKRWGYFVILAILLLCFCSLSILGIGWFGIPQEKTLRYGSCVESYKSYLIKPYIKDFIECSNVIPCPKKSFLAYLEARENIRVCLCKDKTLNRDQIVEYHKDENHGYYKYDDEAIEKIYSGEYLTPFLLE